MSWVSFFLGFFFVVGARGLFAEQVFRAFGHGQQAGLVALHLDDARALSRWIPSPWAIFRAASNSSTKPLILACFSPSSSSSSVLPLHPLRPIRSHSVGERCRGSRATWP